MENSLSSDIFCLVFAITANQRIICMFRVRTLLVSNYVKASYFPHSFHSIDKFPKVGYLNFVKRRVDHCCDLELGFGLNITGSIFLLVSLDKGHVTVYV